MENINHEKKLKITCYKAVKNVCQETAKNMGLGMEKAATDLISELIWKKAKRIAEDLELFAKHGKRSTVNADDIKLLVRHNEKLKEDISKLAEEMKKAKKSKKSNVATDNDFADVDSV